MTKLDKVVRFILLSMLCFSAACSGAVPKTASQQLKISWTPWQGDYTILIARKWGFFSQYGLDVVPIRYDSATQALADLAGSDIDGGIFTMSDLILASNLVDLKGVYITDNGGIYSIVSSPDITKMQQIRDKRIGLNLHTSSELFLTSWLQSGRMSFKDVIYVEMAPNKITDSIPADVDAGLVWEPYTSLAIKQGQKVLYQGDTNSALYPRVMVFRKAVIDKNPEMIRTFLRAWNDTVNYRFSHARETNAIIAQTVGLPISQIVITKGTAIYTLRDNIQLFSVNPEKDPTSIYHIAEVNRDLLIMNGYITVPPDIQTLLDPSYLK